MTSLSVKIISFGFSFRFQSGPKISRGGQQHRRFRFLFFKKPLTQLPLVISNIRYDSFRNCFIFLGVYFNGLFSFDIAPVGLSLYSFLCHGDPKALQQGSRLLLLHIPVGSIIYNIELRPGGGGQLMRSAGMFANLIAKHFHLNYGIIRFRSGLQCKVSLSCCASLGRVSNIDFFNIFRRLAGYSRRCGIRPHVRGVAKNPVDHPNGGRTAGGKTFRNITGRIIKHGKTRRIRSVNFLTNRFIKGLV